MAVMSRRFSINQLPTGSYGITGSFSGSFIGDGSGLQGITATVAPAGPVTAVQFNDGLNNSGSSDFTFDKTTGMALVTSMSIANIYYPTADGTNQQVIKTDGAGNLEFGYPDTITVQVYNSDSITLQKGTPVHATSSGTVGEVTGIVLADAGDVNRMPSTAILNTTLAPGETGEAILTGYIRGVNTVGFVSGEVVYVAVGGGYTQTKPTGSALIQNIGIVTKIDPTNGAGIVYGAGRSNELPNISPNHVWLGNPNSVPTAVSSASLFVDSASFALTASYVTPLQQDVIITGSLLLTGSHIAEVDYIDFNNTGITPPADLEGRIYWDENNGTLSLGMHGGQVVQQIGLEEYFYVKNQTGTTLLNGTVIRSAGTLGASGRLLGDLMIADGTIPYYYTLGITTEDIVDGDDGYVTQFGLVRGINTTGSNGETWNDGDILYVSPTVAGTLTKIEPEAPNLRLQMAIVVHAATNGSIFVRPDLGSDVGSLHNVLDTTTTSSYGELFVKSGSVWTSTTQLTGSYGLTGSLTADSFVGSLTGTASYATIADTAHSASVIADISTDATYYPVLSDGTSGARQLRVDSVLLSYNPSTNTLRTTTFEGNLQGTASYASLALTASYALNSAGGGSTDTGSLLVTASAALNVITFTKGDGSTFPITVDTGSGGGGGGSTDTGSLLVTASISQNIFTFTKGDSSTFDLVFETSSFVLNSQTSSMSVATASYALSGGDAPFPYTGSAQITGSLSINNYLSTATQVIANVGSTTIFTIPTASYDGAWFEYSARSGSNSRAGQITSIWSGSQVNFTETTTIDFGTTADLALGVFAVGGDIALTSSAETSGWVIKTIIRSF